jgi:hypothetical protein
MLAREKNNSRLNATKHGCCAKTLILPDECQEDFDQIRDGWMAEFEPEGYQEQRLVEILILNDWHLQRAQLRLWEAEAALCAGPEEPLERDDRELWDARMQHDLELKQRYKTCCERAFYRAWSVLQGLRKDIERHQVALTRLERQIHKLQSQSEALKKKLGIESQPESEARQTTGQANNDPLNLAPRGSTVYLREL